MSDYYIFTDFETTGYYVNDQDVPIEVGMIIADDEYNILDTYECFINSFDEKKTDWVGEEIEAFKVHNIPFKTIKEKGLNPDTAVAQINMFLANQHAIDFRNTKNKNVRFIIMSDNGPMEYNAMQKLYKLAKAEQIFPFHYSAWDINILINSVQKVMKGRAPHRALQDAFRMYKAVIRALERNGFRKWEK